MEIILIDGKKKSRHAKVGYADYGYFDDLQANTSSQPAYATKGSIHRPLLRRFVDTTVRAYLQGITFTASPSTSSNPSSSSRQTLY